MRKFLYLFFFIAVVFVTAAWAGNSGKKIFLLGDSARALGRAGTGVSSSGIDLFYLNPATIGDLERTSASVQYGTLPLPTKFYNPNLTFAMPSSYGVFGAAFRYLNFPGSRDLRSGYSITVGGAKDLIPELLLGFSLTFFGGLGEGRPYYTGGNFGFIYKFHDTANRHGFCLKDPRLGLSVQFGYPFGTRKNDADFNAITLGYGFTFFSIKNFSMAFFNDASILNYKEYPVKIGLESEIYDILTVRAGYILPQAYNKGSFTTGFGLKLITENFKGSLNYSLNFYPKMRYVHYLGVTGEYGSLDREPPDVEIKVNTNYISPNYDGVKDYALFDVSVSDRSIIKGWKLQVLDAADKIVKEYFLSDRDMINKLDIQQFFRRLFLKKESMVVPEKIIWDGTDSRGETVPDGKYSYSFTAWDVRDNISATKSGALIVDTIPPEVLLEKGDDLFSPNGDNKKDVIVITQKIKTAPNDLWAAGFKDSQGRIVRSYRWEGSAVPGKVTWDGKDDAGTDVPEGVYEYFVGSTDNAGNKAGASTSLITLTRKYEIADITMSSEYFSFNKDAFLTLFPYLSDTKGLEHWKIAILNSKRKTITEITGRERYSKIVEYDCRDAKGEKLEDGVYYVKFAAVFRSGNAPESFEKRFIIDSTPPKLSVSHSPQIFSPDGDGQNDILKIRLSSADLNGIARWGVIIYSSAGDAFKTFTGSGQIPGEILWDGIGKNLEIVESAADYTIVLEAVDNAGNRGVSGPDRVAVDVLVLVTERGLKIRISNIEFPFGSDDIKPGGKSVLDRVQEILQKYEAYDVVIEGHTDDIGREEYNLELSERRARAVHDYLVNSGILIDRLKYVGMGETVPLYPNDGDENRRRNRRVEFLLIRKEAK